MSEDLESRVEQQISTCQGYQGFVERNGLVILCQAMATALTLLLAIYRMQKAR